MRSDITIVTAGRADVLAAWVAAFKRSPNFGKFIVRIGDDGFSDEFRRELTDAGFELFYMKQAGDYSRRLFKGHTPHHAMWHSKIAAIQRGAVTRWAFWLDHDCEVRGDLEPIIDCGLSLGKWLSGPKYASMLPKRYARQRVTQNGMLLVDVENRRVAAWQKSMESRRDPNDETAIPFALGGFDKADASIGDLYRPEWYASVDCYAVVHQSIYVANELLKTNKDAAVRHWCAGCGKRAFMDMYTKEGEEK